MPSIVVERQIKYYMRLEYPVHVTFDTSSFSGTYPDLGLTLSDQDLRRLYARLDERRRAFLLERVLLGQAIPMPNSRKLD